MSCENETLKDFNQIWSGKKTRPSVYYPTADCSRALSHRKYENEKI